MKKLNSGGIKMNVTFCKTKAGNGFKIAVDDMWLYVSKRYLYRVLYNKAKSCQFRQIEDSNSIGFESPFEESFDEE